MNKAIDSASIAISNSTTKKHTGLICVALLIKNTEFACSNLISRGKGEPIIILIHHLISKVEYK